MKANLILEDGSIYTGKSIGAVRDCMCEIVFNTSVVGYVETLSDPSYYGQGVILTYPIVGGYGVNLSDMESSRIWAKCMIVRELSQAESNFRMELTLSEYLCKYGVPGIEGVDTRALTKKIREKGTMTAFLTTEAFDVEEVVEQLKAYKAKNAVKAVSGMSLQRIENDGKKVALIDFGVKNSTLEYLKKRNMDVTVYPYNVTFDEIKGYDGIVLSNGPGNPNENPEVLETIKAIYDADIPTLGLELGHELMALATGGKIEKMNHGHRGGNYPVKFVDKNIVYITSQNHGYVVSGVDEAVCRVTHKNINDGTIEGLSYNGKKIITVQFAPGTETEFIYDDFAELMGGR